MDTDLAGPIAPAFGLFSEGATKQRSRAIFGLREETTLQARLRDGLFQQTTNRNPGSAASPSAGHWRRNHFFH